MRSGKSGAGISYFWHPVKRAILITRQLSQDEMRHLDDVRKADPELSIFTKSLEFVGDIEVGGIEKDLGFEKKKEIKQKILNYILEIGITQIHGTKLAEVFALEGAQTWYYHKFRLYFDLRNLSYEAELINELHREFENLEVFTPYTSYLDLLIEEKNGVRVVKRKMPGKIKWRSLFNYLVTVFLRVVSSTFSSFRSRYKIAVVELPGHYKHVLRLDGKNYELTNVHLGYAFPLMDRDFVMINELIIPDFKSHFALNGNNWKRLNDKPRINSEYILARFLGIRGWRDWKRLKKKWHNALQNLQDFRKDDRYFQLIQQKLASYTPSNNYFLLKYVAYKRFFIKSNLNVVATLDESSANFRLILDAAKTQNIKAVGIQHGSLHKLHPSYRYTSEEDLNSALPDVTFIWGASWKKFLIEYGCYPPDKLRVTGQIRTDLIYNLASGKTPLPAIIEERAKGKKIILYASQPQRDADLRYRAAYDVFVAASNQSESLLVVKLHPLENDENYFHEIASRAGNANYLISKDVDLYQALSRSDVVITCFSTVGTETIYFKKPLVVLDHLKQDILDYVKDGVGRQATNAHELSAVLSEILSGAWPDDQTKEIYNQYIEDHVYKIDGAAGKRFIEQLKALSSYISQG